MLVFSEEEVVRQYRSLLGMSRGFAIVRFIQCFVY